MPKRMRLLWEPPNPTRRGPLTMPHLVGPYISLKLWPHSLPKRLPTAGLRVQLFEKASWPLLLQTCFQVLGASTYMSLPF